MTPRYTIATITTSDEMLETRSKALREKYSVTHEKVYKLGLDKLQKDGLRED